MVQFRNGKTDLQADATELEGCRGWLKETGADGISTAQNSTDRDEMSGLAFFDTNAFVYVYDALMEKKQSPSRYFTLLRAYPAQKGDFADCQAPRREFASACAAFVLGRDDRKCRPDH